MTERGRLVHVTTTAMSLDLLLLSQLRAFQAAGFEVIGASAPGPHVDAIVAAGIEHVALRHATRAMAPTSDIRFFAELVGLFRRLRPEIVHTHNPKPGWAGRPAARIARVPWVVHTTHGLYATPDDRIGRRAVVYGLERAAATFSHVELFQNRDDLATIRRLGVREGKLRLLGNGVDLDRFRPDPAARAAVRAELGLAADAVVVGAVGRLVREKGYRELFDAASAVRASYPDIEFVVAGGHDADKGDALTQGDIDAARTAGVRILGHRDDVERLYPALDVYVLASHREGFPRSAMEAAACGVPVVATDIRGCRDVVEDGATGLLVHPRSPAALAAALKRLAADPEGRRAMGDAGLSKARAEFDVRRVIGRTLAAYERRPPR